MKVLVHGLNYVPEKIGIAVYTAGMAEALVARGHEVRVVSGRPYYPGWRIMEGHSAWRYGRSVENGVTVLRVPHYIPSRPSGPRRVVHHASFALSSVFPMIWQALTWQPDVVLAVAPSLMGAPVARLSAMLGGAHSWLHIQDFEVEAGIATGLLPARGIVAGLARWFERVAIAGFETVSTISPQMCRRLVEKGVDPDRVVEFRNWADIGAIRPLTAPSAYRKQWSIGTEHVALYSGNVANKQGAGIVIEAARQLQHRSDLTFVICGEGPDCVDLRAQAQDLGNVQFHELQPRDRLSELLGLASVHLLPQIAGAADLVLPSKLANMLASGRPVIATAAVGTGLAAEVEGCGLVTPPGDAAAFATAIAALLDDGEARARLGQAARMRADAHWSREAILGEFARQLATRDAPSVRPIASAQVT